MGLRRLGCLARPANPVTCIFTLLAGASPLCAQPAGAFDPGEFLLPIEVTSGFITERGSPLPWTISLRAHPLFALDSYGMWRIGGSTALTFRNPEAEFLFGGILSFHPHARSLPVGGTGVGLSLEGLVGTPLKGGGDEIAFGAFVELAAAWRVGARAARDISRDEFLLELAVGWDPVTWFKPADEP